MIKKDESLTLHPTKYRRHNTLELREFLNMIDALGYGINATVHVTENGALVVKRDAIHQELSEDPAIPTE